MLQQVCHGRPIVQGQTSCNVVVTLRDRLETLNLAAQRRQLADAKVKYIVISLPTGGLFRWTTENGRAGLTIPERIRSCMTGLT